MNQNMNSDHFTEAEKTAILNNLKDLETAVASKLINLTKADRKKYGRVDEQNKLFVNKVEDYQINQPQLRDPDVDWIEYGKDYATREFCENVVTRLKTIFTGLENKKILHDHDNYIDALDDYNYAKYKSHKGTPGYDVKKQELGQFFKKTPKATGKTAPNP
jgi:hypothetical protein